MLPVVKNRRLGCVDRIFPRGRGWRGRQRQRTPGAKGAGQGRRLHTCHNESWRVPILSLYQTRHGTGQIRGRRTASHATAKAPATRQDPGGVHPEVVFAAKSKNVSSARDRKGTCMACHKTGPSHPLGGQRAPNPGRDLQQLPYGAHAERPGTVQGDPAQVCFACHKTQRAETHRISTHPIAAGKVACSDCHNPHGSNGPEAAGKELGQRDLLDLSRRKARSVPLGARLGDDDCMNCHTPHGSTNPPLLRARAPFLCQECHGDGRLTPATYRRPSLPGGPMRTSTRPAASPAQHSFTRSTR